MIGPGPPAVFLPLLWHTPVLPLTLHFPVVLSPVFAVSGLAGDGAQ